MTETVNTSSNDQAAPQTTPDDAAILARSAQSAADRVEREADIETPETAKAKKSKGDLSPLFSMAALASSFLLLHNVPGQGKIGKGPNCVVDHGTHIYIPPNATPAHLQQAAQLAQQKGWNSVVAFRAGGTGIHKEVTAQLQQVAPYLSICTDHRQAGSLYSCRRAVIQNHIAAKQAHRLGMREQAAPAQDAVPQPA